MVAAALPEHLEQATGMVAVVDADGSVIAVNAAWRRRAEARGLDAPAHGVGLSYLGVCAAANGAEADEAGDVARGLRDVIDRRRSLLRSSYRCEGAWFDLQIWPFSGIPGAVALVVHNEVPDPAQLPGVAPADADDWVRGLRNMQAAILESLDADSILLRMARCLADEALLRSVMLALVDHDAGEVRVMIRYQWNIQQGRFILAPGSDDLCYGLDDANVTAQCARTGEEATVETPNDPRLDPRIDSDQSRWIGADGEVRKVAHFYPIRTGDRVMAVLATGATRYEAPDTRRNLDALRPLFATVAIALHHARAHAELQARSQAQARQAELLQAFHAMADDVLSHLEGDEILVRLSRNVVGTGIFRSLNLARVEHDLGQIRFLAEGVVVAHGAVEIRDSFDKGRTLSLADRDVVAEVARTGEVVVIDDPDDPRLDPDLLRQRLTTWGDRVAYFLPVKAGGRIEAVLATASTRAERPRILETIAAIQPLLGHVAIALGHARIYQELADSRVALHRSEAAFGAVFESAILAMAFLDADARVVRANPAMCRFLDRSAEDLTGRALASLAGDDPSTTAVTVPDGTAATEPVELAFSRRDGSRVWGRMRTLWLQTAPTTEAHGFVIIEDVTAEREHDRENVRLERLRAQAALAAGVSHNLNNLLAGIMLPVEKLTFTAPPELQVDLQQVLSTARGAAELVRRLHDSARGEEAEAHPEAVSVAAVVREAVAAARPRWQDEAQASGLRIDIVEDLQDVPAVRATWTGLRDLVLNLILNAVEALDGGGRIVLGSRVRADGRVELRVEDDGIGMDAETRLRAFEPFYTRKATVGTGLGLATVGAAVERWGGEVHLESELGQGTRVYIRLRPAAASAEVPVATPAPAPAPAPVSRDTLRVLLVEDEEVVRRSLTGALEPHEVVAVANAAEATAQLQTPFDVVIIDLGLPDVTGDRLAQTVRGALPDAKLVLLSGWLLADDDPRRAPFDAYLAKPPRLADLRALLDELGKGSA